MTFGRTLFFTIKLQKHLQQKNVKRVRDYLAHLIEADPDLDDCLVDQKLLSRSMNFIRPYYQINNSWKVGDPISNIFNKIAEVEK